MKYVSNNKLYLEPIIKYNGKLKQKSRVWINGHCTQCIVDGSILYECILVHSYYLLFVMYDWEEAGQVTIYLIDQKGIMIDNAMIVASWAIEEWDVILGNLNSIQIISSNKLSFNFNDIFWRLEILKKPIYSWSFFILDPVDKGNCRALVRKSIWEFKTYFKFTRV